MQKIDWVKNLGKNLIKDIQLKIQNDIIYDSSFDYKYNHNYNYNYDYDYDYDFIELKNVNFHELNLNYKYKTHHLKIIKDAAEKMEDVLFAIGENKTKNTDKDKDKDKDKNFFNIDFIPEETFIDL
jgi:hypothetical protein